MENKYYDLIISLIKKHRKYPLYEDILDNIAQDVYEHARIIIESVQNEDVILSYLNKIVSTSIVTVPKRLNYHSRLKNRSALRQATRQTYEPKPRYEAPAPIEEQPSVQEESDEIIEEIALPEEPVQETAAEIEEVSETPAVETELVIEDEFLLEDNNIAESEEETVLEESENLLEEVSIDSLTELALEEEEEEETLFEQPLLETETDYVNKDLVDKMINGVESVTAEPQEEIIENIEVPESITENFELSQESFEALDTLEEIEQTPLEEETEAVNEFINEPLLAETIEETIKEFEIEDIPVSLETEEQEIPTLENIENIEEIEQTDVQDSMLDEEISFVENNEVLPIESFEESAEEIKPLETLDSNEEEPLILQPFADETDSTAEFSIPSYDCFKYSPEDIENEENAQYLSSELAELSNKLPEQKIKSVFELKYNQKMTVKQVAESLGFTEENVINSLNEIIDLIKD